MIAALIGVAALLVVAVVGAAWHLGRVLSDVRLSVERLRLEIHTHVSAELKSHVHNHHPRLRAVPSDG